jgi:amino acid adenylation domain-containing protein
MNLVELLKEVKSRDISLYLNDGQLAFKAPTGAMDKALKAHIVEFKTNIVELLKKSSVSASLGKQIIKPRSSNSFIPLSFAQQRMWFIDKLNEGSMQYNMPVTFKLTGPFDLELFKKVLMELVQRHEILRTNYLDSPQGPIQVVTSPKEIVVNYIELSEEELKVQEKSAASYIRQECEGVFNLQQDLMIRLTCIKLADEEHIIIFNVHHIASDGWSTGVLTKEFMAGYNASLLGTKNQTPPLNIQYGDFALWQREKYNEELIAEQLQFWQKELKDVPEVHNLPLDYNRPVIQTFDGHSIMYHVDKALLAKINHLARERNTTLFTVLQCAFALLLSKWSNEEDIVIGSPVSGRNNNQLEPLIGLFINTLVLRNKVDPKQSFLFLLNQAREYTLGAFSNQELPFERIVEQLQPERSLSYSPIFQILFTLQNNEQVDLDLPNMSLEWIQTDEKMTKFDLELSANETKDGLWLEWKFAKQLFKSSTIDRMATSFEQLLHDIVTDPTQSTGKFSVVPKADIDLLQKWNETDVDYSIDLCIHQLFELSVKKTPTAVAAVCGEHSITYQELNDKANLLAHVLIDRGVEPSQLIGLCIDRSIQMLVAILAVLKSGATYVPLSANYPAERINYIINDSGMKLVLSESKYQSLVGEGVNETLFIDLIDDFSGYSKCNPDIESLGVTPEHSAYLIYTSGSTGHPKGVEIRHRNTVSMLHWAAKMFIGDELEKVLASTSLSFDLSIFEIFLPLCFGQQCIIVEDALALLTSQPEVTLINTVPSAIKVLLENDAIPSSTRVVNLAGESLAKEIINDLLERSHCQRAFNLYGPSEDTTYSTYNEFNDKISRVPEIGQPIDNTKTYILSKDGNILPIGVIGELYLSGAGLAKGYYNKPELTSEKFIVKSLLADELRLYRTGDLARYQPDGKLQFFGRIDEQVKLRGFRVELGEIEHHIRNIDNIKDVAVAVNGKVHEQILTAYIVSEQVSLDDVVAQTDMINAIRVQLSDFLLDYMIPDLIIFLENLPLNANGKLNRKALPEVNHDHRATKEYKSANSPTEQKLSELWLRILKVESIGVTESFFDAGGNSLLLTQLFADIKAMFGVEISIKAMFLENTIEKQANLVDSRNLFNGSHDSDVELEVEEF